VTATGELLEAPVPLAATPVPAGRGRWRAMAYKRQFSSALPTQLSEMTRARGRRLERKWNTAAQFTFTLDGHDPEAAVITELATDVVLWRWDDTLGRDVVMFRGLIDHAEDQLSESSAVVTFTAHDYFALLSRRIYTSTGQVTGDQDSVVQWMILTATTNAFSSSGTSFMPGAFLPLSMTRTNPDGTNRSTPGPQRTRTYQAGAVIGAAIDDLAHVQDGFDYDVAPAGPSYAYDSLRIFYPTQGVDRSADMTLAYGANVSGVTRTVATGDYGNYVRVIGNKASTDPAAPQLYAEAWNTDANNVTVNPVGLWQTSENASDVSVQQTLTDKANGDLAYGGLLTPSYTLTLRPNTYSYGYPNMGDTVPLVITEGRLAVNTTVRVVGIDYSVGDDGQEDVALTVGRPPASLARILRGGARDIDALARR